MLEEGGAFRRDPVALPHLASASAFRRYRRGDLLLTAGAPAPDAFFIVAGQLAVMVPTGEGDIRLELGAAGQLMVLRGMLAGGPEPLPGGGDPGGDRTPVPAPGLVGPKGPTPGGRRGIHTVPRS